MKLTLEAMVLTRFMDSAKERSTSAMVACSWADEGEMKLPTELRTRRRREVSAAPVVMGSYVGEKQKSIIINNKTVNSAP